MTITASAEVAIHQIDGYVWCDTHDEVHDRTPTSRTERGIPGRCNAEAWRPVYTTDSKHGTL